MGWDRMDFPTFITAFWNTLLMLQLLKCHTDFKVYSLLIWIQIRFQGLWQNTAKARCLTVWRHASMFSQGGGGKQSICTGTLLVSFCYHLAWFWPIITEQQRPFPPLQLHFPPFSFPGIHSFTNLILQRLSLSGDQTEVGEINPWDTSRTFQCRKRVYEAK